MDMHVALPTPSIGLHYPAPATEYASLAEHRRQLFALIGEFRKAVARPRGRKEAVRILKAIVPCSSAYFDVAESLLDKISAAGAAPHQNEHRRILNELKSALERCSSSAVSGTADLVHALDTLVMHEATIRLRAPENRASTRSSVATALPL
jgi:hemerythrin